MKKFCTCLVAVLVLTSCTPVEEFGPYWDKGFADPALEGSWKKLGLPGEDIDGIPGADVLQFTKDGSSYLAYMINPIDLTKPADEIEQQKADNAEAMSARTLRIGKHLFLMQRGPGGRGKGYLVRYEIKRGTLDEYFIDNGLAVDFLLSKHPTAKNISKNVAEGTYVVINTFDDEVFQVLSEIADKPAYWNLQCQVQESPLMHGSRGAAATLALAMTTVAGCSHRVPNDAEWAADLAVRPGSTLPRENASQKQVITPTAAAPPSPGTTARSIRSSS